MKEGQLIRHVRYASEIDLRRRRLPFYLATEEWVARRKTVGNYFFSWRVEPTVICGRNQDIEKEVDLGYCERVGIDVVRRRSGGGAVYADMNNFMFSYITSGDNVQEEFRRYTEMIAEALRGLGISAEATGRNDVTIGGRKVSGNAFYHIPGRCIAHGTMLYDYDGERMRQVLTPSRAKMESKRVKSVESRVTSLMENGINLSVEEFEGYMINCLTSEDACVLGVEDVREIEEIERGYYRPEFLRIGEGGKSEGSGHRVKSKHIDGFGEMCVEYELDESKRMHDFKISGDFFMDVDLGELAEGFEGLKEQGDEIERLLKALKLEIL